LVLDDDFLADFDIFLKNSIVKSTHSDNVFHIIFIICDCVVNTRRFDRVHKGINQGVESPMDLYKFV
jgi:hypothetical protein